MANPEHLELVRAGSAALNAWRAAHPGVQLDLSGADLRRIELTAEKFPGPETLVKNLRDGTTMLYRNARPANLSGADLRRARLGGADLTDADLSSADIREASLKGVSLARAMIRMADCRGADLSWSDLGWSSVADSDLSAARLVRSDLMGANLSGVLFRNAVLHEVHFSEVQLRDAVFHGAHFSRTIFSGTDLGTANWSGSQHSERCYIDSASLYRTAATIAQGRMRRRELEAFLDRCGLEIDVLELFRASIGQPIEFYSAFISYSRADRDFALALYDALQVRGVKCWLDERELLPGDELYEEIARAVRVHDKVLLCCSEASLQSWWVENEIDIVFEREQQRAREGRKQLSLIPLNVDGHLFSWESGRAAQIRKRLAADFVGWKEDTGKFTEQVERLARALVAQPSSAVRGNPTAERGGALPLQDL